MPLGALKLNSRYTLDLLSPNSPMLRGVGYNVFQLLPPKYSDK